MSALMRLACVISLMIGLGLHPAFAIDAPAIPNFKPEDNGLLWEVLLDESRKLFGAKLPESDSVQISVIPVPVEFDKPQLYEYIASWQFGNRVPSPGDAYAPGQNQIWREYRRFLRSIWIEPTSKDPELRRRFREASTSLVAASQKVARIREEARTKYDAYETQELAKVNSEKQLGRHRQPPLRYEDWLTTPDYGDYATKIATAAIAEEEAATNFVSAVGEYLGPKSLDAQDIFDALKYEPSDVRDRANRRVRVPPFNISGDLSQLVQRAQAAKPGASVTWSTSSRDASQRYERRTQKRRGSAGWGPFKISGSRNETTEKTVNVDDTTRLTITYGAIQSFPLLPGDWWNAALIEKYKCGPFVQQLSEAKRKDNPLATGDAFSLDSFFKGNDALEADVSTRKTDQSLADTNPTEYFFGENGTLNRITTDLIIAVRPSLSLQLNKEAYGQLKREFSGGAGGGFSIGQFSFSAGGGDSGSDNVQRWDDASNTVTFTDMTDIPLLVAVRTQRIPRDGRPVCE